MTYVILASLHQSFKIKSWKHLAALLCKRLTTCCDARTGDHTKPETNWRRAFGTAPLVWTGNGSGCCESLHWFSPSFYETVYWKGCTQVPHNSNITPVWRSALPVLGIKLKRGYLFWVFFKIGLCSAISFERSRRKHSFDVAEHRPILETKGVMRILIIFQDWPMFNHAIRKVSAKTFLWCGWT